MEANYRETCDFEIDRLGEKWRITGCWIIRYDNTVAWWDGETIRNGIKFHRIFNRNEVSPPPIEHE